MWPPRSIKTKSLTSVNKISRRVCTTPGLISFSSGENCIVVLFSECPINFNLKLGLQRKLQLSGLSSKQER